MDKNKIMVFEGVGFFKDKNMVFVMNVEGKSEEIFMKNVIIVIGFKLNYFLGMELDKKWIIIFMEVLSF